jgi:large exoprotein involved in heme utilization and adhesion
MMTADTLTLQDGGIIQAETRGSGTGSRVDLNLRTLELTGGGTISVGSTSSGQGGDLNIYAEESVNISGAMLLGEDESATGSCIYAYAPNVAGLDASQIDIDSTTLTLADGGAIFSFATGEGQAADISIQASASVSISGFQSNLLNVISSQTGGSGDAGNIQVNTGTLTLTGTGGIETISSGIGEAGDIDLYVSSLTIQDGGMIYASALDQGNGGNITVSASEFIDTSGYFEDSPSGLCFQALISACTWQNGNAGNISLSAPVITLADKGNIDAFSFGSGNAGDIDIACSSLTLDGEGAYIYTDIAGSGNGGDIKIITDQLTITGGAGISADVYGVDPNIIEANNATWDTDLSTGTGEATGQGGTLSITATDSVIISGTNDDRDISSSLSTSTSSSGNGGNLFLSTPNVMISDGGWIQATAKNDGNSGNIQIDVEILTLTNGGQVNATTTGTGHGGNIDISASKQIAVSGDYNEEQLSGIQARTKGSGDAGEISVSSPLLTMANGGEINVSSLDGTGNGGSIRIDASFMDMQSNAAISAQSTGNGRAGSLFIQTDEAISLHSSRITTESLDANGGNITLNTVDHLYLLDGQITTSVQGGSGNGGNIDIDPCFVVLNNSQIIANAFEGNGGNIHIVSDYFLAGPESTVMASSQLGIDGTVQIDSPDTDISGRLANLKTPDLDVTALLHSSCALKTMDTSSSLIVTGRGGVLSAPDDFMSIVYFDDESEDVLAK